MVALNVLFVAIWAAMYKGIITICISLEYILDACKGLVLVLSACAQVLEAGRRSKDSHYQV